VNATTCTPELQAKYGISLADSWTGAALKYSYEACADPWSAPQAQEVVDYSPQTFSQYDDRACPYSIVADISLDLPEWGRCEHKGCRLDLTWPDITAELVRGTIEAKIGGLGRLMNASYGVWICVNHWCASTDDHFCFVYHETEHHFVPWGPNSELQLITGQMEGTRSARNNDANDANANFQLLGKTSTGGKQAEQHHRSQDRARNPSSKPLQNSVDETTAAYALRAKTRSSAIVSDETAQDGKSSWS
jgi:hypothetical protein